MTAAAHSFVRDLDPAPVRDLCVDRHYLLAVTRGALRLEVDGTSWTLPPARAALVTAGTTIAVTVLRTTTTASVLFRPDVTGPPAADLAVFDLSPLARSLVAECSRWQVEDEPLDRYALAMFGALAAVTWESAKRPSPTSMPTGRSPEVRRALEITASSLLHDPRFDDIAQQVGLAPRTLARRFEHELGMTWRAALRRLRVLRAVELLAGTDRSVTRIALDVGYASLSAFQAAFRELTGQTPTQYRAGFA